VPGDKPLPLSGVEVEVEVEQFGRSAYEAAARKRRRGGRVMVEPFEGGRACPGPSRAFRF
jgi:hypothetical protein